MINFRLIGLDQISEKKLSEGICHVMSGLGFAPNSVIITSMPQDYVPNSKMICLFGFSDTAMESQCFPEEINLEIVNSRTQNIQGNPALYASVCASKPKEIDKIVEHLRWRAFFDPIEKYIIPKEEETVACLHGIKIIAGEVLRDMGKIFGLFRELEMDMENVYLQLTDGSFASICELDRLSGHSDWETAGL
jgi:hypothetical protein